MLFFFLWILCRDFHEFLPERKYQLSRACESCVQVNFFGLIWGKNNLKESNLQLKPYWLFWQILKIVLKPGFKGETEFKIKVPSFPSSLLSFCNHSENSLKVYLIWNSEVFYDTIFILKSRFLPCPLVSKHL